MATVSWIGGAPSIAQVDGLTVGGTIEADDIFTVTIGYKTVYITGGSTDAATVAATIQAALEALDSTSYPEFAEITWSVVSAVVYATANEPGIPFEITVDSTEAGGGAKDDQTFTRAAVTANSGPHDGSVGANWSGGSVPGASDTVVFEDTDISLKYGLDLNAATWTLLVIKSTFTGEIGLPSTNPNGYPEYRDQYLQVDATTIEVGYGTADGSGRIKMDCSGSNSAVTVYGTAQPISDTGKSLTITNTGATATLDARKGSIDVSPFAGQSATFATVTVSHRGNITGDVDLETSENVTITTLNMSGGAVILGKAPTTINQSDGILTTLSSTITTATIDGGLFYPESSGTITTMVIADGGRVDCSRSPVARTVTNLTMYSNSAFYDPLGVMTVTNGIDLYRCGMGTGQGNDGSVSLVWGEHYTVTKSSI